MTVQLIIIVKVQCGVSESGTELYKNAYKRSAAMSIKDLVAKYKDWMSTHDNWRIEPVHVDCDF